MRLGSKGERNGGVHQRLRMSVITRFKQGKERKPEQPSPASTWATPHSVLTCTAYGCLGVSPDPFFPWYRTTTETIHCPHSHSHRTALPSQLSALGITILDLPTFLASTPADNLLFFALPVPS
ncbi:hypothetical protein E2C01_020277 [Portunus trituberculatus]|uniref:Uncharacterized protein n=1 Tax=Portunus trituberculatus TaxID=210409 RepID=A0A5B7E1U6_PORTR|nr:hypothetical protein [Portunus trituberculatus]